MILCSGTTTDPRQTLYDMFMTGDYCTYNRYSYQLAVTRQYEEKNTTPASTDTIPGIKVTNLETKESLYFTCTKECASYYNIDPAGVTDRLAGRISNPSKKGSLKNLLFERN